MTSRLQGKLSENVHQLLGRVLDENPLHQRFILNAIDKITCEELQQLDEYLVYCLTCGLGIEYLARSYLTIVEDTLNEQLYFIKNKEYRNKSFADVADSVYLNDDYMHRYMHGLAITSFFWPNHLGLARFFRQSLPKDKSGRYLEVGPGHGYYLLSAMRESKFDNFLCIDISEASIAQTRNIVEYFKPAAWKSAKLLVSDFLDVDELEEKSFDAIVMGEVLEHVERPEVFLRRVAHLAKKDSYIFITTCINAPAIDHIYLWRDTKELEAMFKFCGLGIKQALHLPYHGKTVPQCVINGLSINVAYVLEKL